MGKAASAVRNVAEVGGHAVEGISQLVDMG